MSSAVGPAPTDALRVLFTLDLAPTRRLLVVDVADDPTYRALEPQGLEAPDGRIGVVVLGYRHDGHVELYVPPDIEVDEADYRLGRGLLGVYPARFDQARFEVTREGLQLDIAFTASNGRMVALHVHEHLSGRRDGIPVLAPVGGSFAAPEFFPFFWLPALSFVPVRGTESSLRVDGEARTIPRMPLPIGGRRRLLARYDSEAMICRVNAAVASRRPTTVAGASPTAGLELVDVDGRPGIASVRVRREDHICSLMLEPAVPDIGHQAPSTRCRGTVTLEADGVVQLRGRYELEGHDGHADVSIQHFGPWRARPRGLLLSVLFRLPVFRRWPMTYRWGATLDLGDGVTLVSRWSRAPGGWRGRLRRLRSRGVRWIVDR
jgi:hypothetical protein